MFSIRSVFFPCTNWSSCQGDNYSYDSHNHSILPPTIHSKCYTCPWSAIPCSVWYKTNINTGLDCCHDLSELRCAWELKPLSQFLYKVQFHWNFVPSGYSAINHFYKMMRSAYLSLCHAYLPHHICHGWWHKPYQYIGSNKWYVLYTDFICQYASVQHKCTLLRIFSLHNFI